MNAVDVMMITGWELSSSSCRLLADV